MQSERVRNSAKLLNVSIENVKVFLAGECWEDGETTIEGAHTAGYSTLHESGNDITITVADRKQNIES